MGEAKLDFNCLHGNLYITICFLSGLHFSYDVANGTNGGTFSSRSNRLLRDLVTPTITSSNAERFTVIPGSNLPFSPVDINVEPTGHWQKYTLSPICITNPERFHHGVSDFFTFWWYEGVQLRVVIWC